MNKGSRVAKLILFIAILILLLIIILQNLNPATIHLLFWKIENLPVIAILLVTLVLGYILGLLTFSLIFRSRPDKAALEEETFLEEKPAKSSRKKTQDK